MNESDVRGILKLKIKECGGDKGFASQVGMQSCTISNIRSGRKPLTPRILDALGLEAIVSVKYQKKKPAIVEVQKASPPYKRLFNYGDFPRSGKEINP